MINWNVDEKVIKMDPKQYELWRVSQLINYGLDGEKLDTQYLKLNWVELSKRIDPTKKATLDFMLAN